MADAGRGEENRTRDLVIDFLHNNNFKIVKRNEDPRYDIRGHIEGLKNASSELATGRDKLRNDIIRLIRNIVE